MNETLIESWLKMEPYFSLKQYHSNIPTVIIIFFFFYQRKVHPTFYPFVVTCNGVKCMQTKLVAVIAFIITTVNNSFIISVIFLFFDNNKTKCSLICYWETRNHKAPHPGLTMLNTYSDDPWDSFQNANKCLLTENVILYITHICSCGMSALGPCVSHYSKNDKVLELSY